MKKPFDPNDYSDNLTVKDVVEKFPQLKNYDYTVVSLNEKLIELNYEIIVGSYEDRKFKDIEKYYDIGVDTVV